MRLTDVVVGHPGRDVALIPSRLVKQRRDNGRQARRVEALPEIKAQTLGRQQVLLGIEPLEIVALRGHRGATLGEIAEVHQKLADAVERTSDRVAPALDRAGDPVGLPAQPPPTFGPPCMVLALGAPVARVRAHLPAQFADALLFPRSCLLYTSD